MNSESFKTSCTLLSQKKEKLVAPLIVFAELLPQFKGNIRELNEFLEEHKIGIEPLDVDSAIAAAQAWMRYLKRKTKVKCPQCGRKLNLKEYFSFCRIFISEVLLRQSVAPFLPETDIHQIFPQVGYENCLKNK